MALSSSLISYWKLDESGTGARNDSVGSNNLTNNNGVTQGTSVSVNMVNSASFLGSSSQSLSIVSNSSLQVPSNGSFSLVCWVYFTSVSGEQWVVSKKTDDDVTREYVIRLGALSAGQIDTSMTFTGGNINTQASNFGSLVANTWYFCSLRWDYLNNTVWTGVNGVYNTGTPSGTNSTSTGTFRMGTEVGTTHFLTGNMDGVGYWKSFLTNNDLAILYNMGKGMQYPFTYLQTNNHESVRADSNNAGIISVTEKIR